MDRPTAAADILQFLKQLAIEAKLPKGVQVLNPYLLPSTFALCEQFYKKYYDDRDQRTLMLGINPGRFGSGTTGISFTDPLKLQDDCAIVNDLPRKPELSADFIYKVIHAFGGPEKFYCHYFISSVSPLGFTMEGVNINYYDIPKLQTAITPFIVASINSLCKLNINREKCYCIGEGKNLKFLSNLNNQYQWFKSIVPLSHPRFIMQYKRKQVDEYVMKYLRELIPNNN